MKKIISGMVCVAAVALFIGQVGAGAQATSGEESSTKVEVESFGKRGAANYLVCFKISSGGIEREAKMVVVNGVLTSYVAKTPDLNLVGNFIVMPAGKTGKYYNVQAQFEMVSRYLRERAQLQIEFAVQKGKTKVLAHDDKKHIEVKIIDLK